MHLGAGGGGRRAVTPEGHPADSGADPRPRPPPPGWVGCSLDKDSAAAAGGQRGQSRGWCQRPRAATQSAGAKEVTTAGGLALHQHEGLEAGPSAPALGGHTAAVALPAGKPPGSRSRSASTCSTACSASSSFSSSTSTWADGRWAEPPWLQLGPGTPHGRGPKTRAKAQGHKCPTSGP